jgi:plastocyanin
MRSWLLLARVALVGVVAALVVVSDGSAAPKVVMVAITATGPSPSTVTVSPFGAVRFVNHDSVAHTVILRKNAHARWTCPLGPAGEPPAGSDQCENGNLGFVSSQSYTVDGRFPGKVVVVGLARSVSLTARTHTVALGKHLTLHGQITYETQGGPICRFSNLIRVLARTHRGKPFKRIAMFTVSPPKNVRASKDRCTVPYQLTVRPGTGTTYIARVTGNARIWRLATSRAFTVLVGR